MHSKCLIITNIFELVPTINSMKDQTVPVSAISSQTFDALHSTLKIWIEDIFGLKGVTEADNEKLQGVMQLLIDIRKEAKKRKDFATSDMIRNQLAGLGILLKDEKSGDMSWNIE